MLLIRRLQSCSRRLRSWKTVSAKRGTGCNMQYAIFYLYAMIQDSSHLNIETLIVNIMIHHLTTDWIFDNVSRLSYVRPDSNHARASSVQRQCVSPLCIVTNKSQ